MHAQSSPGPSPASFGEIANQVGLVGRSEAHRQLLQHLAKLARVNAEVLLCGPTGVGKELYARFLHECSDRARERFVALNCGAIPDALFENELFGHMAGAYTGAQAHADGLVAAAEGGTLFLDEINSLSAGSQVKLLRLLQEKEYRRLGETRLRRVDIRFVSAANTDLRRLVEAGQFREDLYFRLRVVPIQVPALRERLEDVAVLLLAFSERYAVLYGLPAVTFSPRAWDALLAYHWPGNIRELENCIRGLTCQQFERAIEPADLPLLENKDSSASRPRDLLAQPFHSAKSEVVRTFEVQYLEAVLHRTGGNIAEAARLAGKHRRAFFALLRKHRIRAAGFKMAAPGTQETTEGLVSAPAVS